MAVWAVYRKQRCMYVLVSQTTPTCAMIWGTVHTNVYLTAPYSVVLSVYGLWDCYSYENGNIPYEVTTGP